MAIQVVSIDFAVPLNDKTKAIVESCTAATELSVAHILDHQVLVLFNGRVDDYAAPKFYKQPILYIIPER